MKMATPRAVGMARISANSDTKRVTCSSSKIPKCIADVSPVIQGPP